jgi:hypothetical protein
MNTGPLEDRLSEVQRRGGILNSSTVSDVSLVRARCKGLIDELLRWQTGKLQQIESSRDDHTVCVRPDVVFDGVQTSTRYPGGMALRFARVLRYREDKTPAEVSTVNPSWRSTPPNPAIR